MYKQGKNRSRCEAYTTRANSACTTDVSGLVLLRYAEKGELRHAKTTYNYKCAYGDCVLETQKFVALF